MLHCNKWCDFVNLEFPFKITRIILSILCFYVVFLWMKFVISNVKCWWCIIDFHSFTRLCEHKGWQGICFWIFPDTLLLGTRLGKWMVILKIKYIISLPGLLQKTKDGGCGWWPDAKKKTNCFSRVVVCGDFAHQGVDVGVKVGVAVGVVVGVLCFTNKKLFWRYLIQHTQWVLQLEYYVEQ